jgi:hypothetical protein
MSTGDDYGPVPSQAPEPRKETEDWENAKGVPDGGQNDEVRDKTEHSGSSRGRIRRWMARLKR